MTFIDPNNPSAETLFRQAPMTAADYMCSAVEEIDKQFGEGFAKQHPELVAAFMQTSALDYGASLIARAVEGRESVTSAIDRLADATQKIADEQSAIGTHLKYLGNGDAATTMGAIEGLGMVVGEKLDRLADAVQNIDLSSALELNDE